ncbi:TetR/AcrR family transcriptional regulator [Saccharothrix syringae]|uniref:TetR/AcrR family transcriptional regulator n=1 Tax=Saccharothrix syringae TaxID=103733 RepID=A0A5Q0H4H7_SACSY|nr:TetR/AcrR family transcriptional regulator [Saccharothrix syringae]QFZ20903.1 TetR/AcrR family transcriptional regulator [Saccharothrix syringae]
MTKAPATGDGPSTPSRPRNRRGEGPRLREDIVRAATALIVRAGTDQALTLRSVAREVGISAPSIYAHFTDREAIVEAVVLEAITQLHEAVGTAVTAHGDPVEGLLAGCAAYVDFGTREPARYRVLFDWSRPKPDTARADDPGLDAFRVLVDNLEACVRAGRSTSTDPFADAVALWTALHGRVLLRASLPDFPWPAADTLERTVLSLGRITSAAQRQCR